ncbi:uncharacterized protein LOC144742712 [Ciona intestinalis]
MAFQISPPEAFNFQRPQEWESWIGRFERYKEASGLVEASASKQVNTLMYLLGSKGDDILSSFHLTEQQAGSYAEIKGRFDNYFNVRRNVIYERSLFNRRYQYTGESVDDFITSLYTLASSCNYGQLREEMIRDRLVVGIGDRSLSERLQLMADLTLERAISVIRNTDVVKKQQPMLKEQHSYSLDLVRTKRGGGFKVENRRAPQPFFNQRSNQRPRVAARCEWCGRNTHPRKFCPASNATCYACGTREHFKSRCKTHRVHNVVTETETAFLGSISTSGTDERFIIVHVNEIPVEFKIDTGADVTVIGKDIYELFKTPLERSALAISGPKDESLAHDGMFVAKLRIGERVFKEEIHVIPGLSQALLGWKAIKNLKALAKICELEVNLYRRRFPKLFSGLGNFGEAYNIKLKDNAKPFCLSTPRRIAHPLLKRVQIELQHMKASGVGVITRITQPTDWCSGMVVVPKPNGKAT